MEKSMINTAGITRKTIDWMVSQTLIPYPEALAEMEARVTAIAKGSARELVWLLEHPPLYTAGTSAKPEHLAGRPRFPVFETGRGGQYTYHGPGQRVVYVMLDLNTRGRDIRKFVQQLESWVIAVLQTFGIDGETRPGRVGVWVPRPELGPEREDKIAAIGIRVRRWVSFHGLSLNVAPNLTHYADIVPCGIDSSSSPFGVTSLHDLGHKIDMAEIDQALQHHFEHLFGPVQPLS